MNKNDYFIRIIKYNSNAKSSSNAYCNLWTFRRKHSMHKLFELFSIDEFNGNEIQVWSLSFNICITVNVVKKKIIQLDPLFCSYVLYFSLCCKRKHECHEMGATITIFISFPKIISRFFWHYFYGDQMMIMKMFHLFLVIQSPAMETQVVHEHTYSLSSLSYSWKIRIFVQKL